MADIHQLSFPVSWPIEDMQSHLQKDLCIGIGRPLEAFILVRIAVEQADVLTIAADPAHRRKGHGRALLAAAETKLKENRVTILYLDVSEKNDGALALYRSCKFQAVGRRPAYYRTAAGRIASITFSKTL